VILKVGIECDSEGRTIAWVLEYPGCFAYGKDKTEALQNLPISFHDYNEWLADYALGSLKVPLEVETQVEETWQVYQINDNFELDGNGYEVNAWFRHDWKPLSETEIEQSRQLLAISRKDILSAVQDLDEEQLDLKRPNERWSISGILNHVGSAEWWYLDRLGLAFPRAEVPTAPFERLEVVRAHLVRTLHRLAGSNQVVGIDGEFWSPRKVLRRAIWHERDHSFHIRKLRSP
jgi:hypothetical protein